jgi:hypothetical protein
VADALDGQEQRRGFVATVARKALLSLATAAASAGSAYLVRKASQLWEEQLLPKLEEKGGGRAAARELLEATADKAPETLKGVAEKVASPSSAPSENRDEERRRREQRRRQRRRSLEQAGSS